MKKFFIIVFLLAACSAQQVPAVTPPTSTSIPTSVPTVVVPSATATTEVILPTNTMEPTQEPSNTRLSPIDGMPQVFIPAGKFRMGGMDTRSAPDERPAHYVTLHSYWMDQLEVTNAMYALCIQSGPCTPPQSFKSLRRTDYFNNPEFKDYPVVYVTWAQANAYCEWTRRRLAHLPVGRR
jgi:formylglycine-generating enzyme required for sulfatase activity